MTHKYTDGRRAKWETDRAALDVIRAYAAATKAEVEKLKRPK